MFIILILFLFCVHLLPHVCLNSQSTVCFSALLWKVVARTTYSATGLETTSLIHVTEEELGKGLLRWL